MVIRMRHTRAHSKNRRSHHRVSDNAIVKDKETNIPHMRHRVCLETGRYNGRQVIDLVKKVSNKKDNK